MSLLQNDLPSKIIRCRNCNHFVWRDESTTSCIFCGDDSSMFELIKPEQQPSLLERIKTFLWPTVKNSGDDVKRGE